MFDLPNTQSLSLSLSLFLSFVTYDYHKIAISVEANEAIVGAVIAINKRAAAGANVCRTLVERKHLFGA